MFYVYRKNKKQSENGNIKEISNLIKKRVYAVNFNNNDISFLFYEDGEWNMKEAKYFIPCDKKEIQI